MILVSVPVPGPVRRTPVFVGSSCSQSRCLFWSSLELEGSGTGRGHPRISTGQNTTGRGTHNHDDRRAQWPLARLGPLGVAWPRHGSACQ
eukprot:3605835-Rhodomonas_salina.2